MLGDRETQSCPFRMPGLVRLVEALEDTRLVDLGYSHAGIADSSRYEALVASDDDGDPAAGGRELDRVVHEIEQHLLDPGPIDGDRYQSFADVDRHGQSSAFDLRAQPIRSMPNDLARIDHLQIQWGPPCLQSCHIEQIFNQCGQPIHFAQDSSKKIISRLPIVDRSCLERLGQGPDRRKRRSQFVRDIGNKIAAHQLQPPQARHVSQHNEAQSFPRSVDDTRRRLQDHAIQTVLDRDITLWLAVENSGQLPRKLMIARYLCIRSSLGASLIALQHVLRSLIHANDATIDIGQDDTVSQSRQHRLQSQARSLDGVERCLQL